MLYLWDKIFFLSSFFVCVLVVGVEGELVYVCGGVDGG